MMNTPTSPRSLNLFAGIGYLIIFVSGIYANFVVLDSMIVPDDAMGTWNQITAQSGLFRMGMLAFVVMVIFDTLLTWALYHLLKHVRPELSQLAAWLRLVNCALFGAALVHLFQVTALIGPSAQPDADLLSVRAMEALDLFNYTWLIGLIFFGLHLVVLGYLVFRSISMPSWIGILLFVAGLGYLTDSFAQFMLPTYDDVKDVFMMVVSIPGVIGELSLTIWLLVRGGRTSVAPASATGR
ncbi:MAG: DUF4386 domain-containing protein [Saprospiraceae bacterium]